ncbi:hypothetical protein C366_04289 [Cryptococcus neoformans Tu401-1]|nr:hypothetical protein C365_06157 [Cryptococcus neoformans var. grubii Bt85]OXG15697.1 hypothetical protein C366_04289 [Cryptococcus neoformans var. grubii Tu401-1]OXM78334.1 hypothetical protein C364_04273 [Cryptococcus neoformans var. grubii Bt63]
MIQPSLPLLVTDRYAPSHRRLFSGDRGQFGSHGSLRWNDTIIRRFQLSCGEPSLSLCQYGSADSVKEYCSVYRLWNKCDLQELLGTSRRTGLKDSEYAFPGYPNYAMSSPLNHQDTLPLNIVDKVIGILATQHGLSSLTANDGESEDENTLEGDEENHDEVFRTTNITDKRRRWRDVKGNWPPSGRWPIVAMTRVEAIMIRKRVRSEKKRWRVPRVGCLFRKE